MGNTDCGALIEKIFSHSFNRPAMLERGTRLDLIVPYHGKLEHRQRFKFILKVTQSQEENKPMVSNRGSPYCMPTAYNLMARLEAMLLVNEKLAIFFAKTKFLDNMYDSCAIIFTSLEKISRREGLSILIHPKPVHRK